MRTRVTCRAGIPSSRSEDGFGLVELLVAMTIFAVVSAPLAGVMLASVGQQALARERTLATQTAQTAVEAVRALPYTSVGNVNGNPTGTVALTQQASQLGLTGFDATVTTRISYMDDAPSTAYRTRADYKKVVVTVTRNSDGKRLAQDATYVAPPGGGAYAGQNEGIVVAQVVDFALNTPVVGALVTLSGGPSPQRSDTTDPAGSVVFPSLLPTTQSQPRYSLTVDGSTGYATLREDTPPSPTGSSSMVGGQTYQTVLRVYRPATIFVGAANSNGSAYTGSGTVTVSSSRGTQSYAWNFAGGPLTVSTIAGEKVVPNVQYTARVLASNGTTSTPVTQLVPASYPTDLTRTFTTTLGGAPATMQTLTVKVVNASNAKVAGAAVTVSGGPSSNVLLAGTTDATGTAVFTVPSNSSPGYTATATSGALTGSASGGVTGATTRTVTVQ